LKKALKLASKILPWVIIIAIALLFWRALSNNIEALRDVDLHLDWWLVGGTVLFTLAVVVSGLLWGRLLAYMSGTKVSISDAVRIHAASWVLKYIPGQVGSVLNKIAWGNKVGLSKKTVTNSVIYENVLMVIASVLLSIPVVFMFSEELSSNASLFLPLLVVVPMLIIFFPKAFYWLLNKALALVKRKPFAASDVIRPLPLVGFQLGYLIPRILNGIGFVFIVESMVGMRPEWVFGVAATYILASIIGMLAIFVPGGLGVREAVAVALLSAYIPVAQAIVVTLVARLCATVSDALVALIYFVLNKGRLKQQ